MVGLHVLLTALAATDGGAGGIDLTTVIVAVLGGGFLTGLIALLKFKPEKEAIVVSAAQGAVVIQSGVIDDLQDSLDRTRAEVAAAQQQVAAMREELSGVREELAAVTQQRDQLRDKVAELERENEELRERVQHLEARGASSWPGEGKT